ncbi:MAG TPA: histidine kinase [Kineosporiaceae bacterium]|nr:histidine kinase [Kineosporiaceae bacterium]
MTSLPTLGLAGLLLLIGLVDVVSVRGLGTAAWVCLGIGFLLAGPALLLSLIHRRMSPVGSVMAGVGLASASLLYTVLANTEAAPRSFPSLLELTAMLVLLVIRVRRWNGHGDTVALALLVVATIVIPTRDPHAYASSLSLVVSIAVVVAIVVGWSLRAGDSDTATRLLSVRNAERRDIARDLHDDVAHHVTGIIVAAQAAAVVAEQNPAAAGAALKAIERAGIEALQSMRSIVSILRVPSQDDVGDSAARRSAARWPEDLEALLERFERTTGVATTLTIDAVDVPMVHRQAVQRVTQEALTNISRHAHGVTRTEVVLRHDELGLHLTVTDDGRPTPTRRTVADSGGGFGLVGVRERAGALGGSVQIGRLKQGGWQVRVDLPLPASAGLKAVSR